MGDFLFISIGISGYAIFTTIIVGGWFRAQWLGKKNRLEISRSPASILIPFRNEEKRITPLIFSIKNVLESFKTSEFIFIDDHSDDDSIRLLEEEFEDFQQVRILKLPTGLSGKKAAISYGISQASNEIIMTTDADCEFSEEALQAMLNALGKENIQMVCGSVVQYSGDGFGAKLSDLEFLSLIGSGISFWGSGFPLMANGAFLGFKKTAFHSVDGFGGNEQFPGGDDVFLLHKIISSFGSRCIHFITGANGAIKTKGDTSLTEFIQRRIRWGAKAKAYQSFSSKLSTVFVFVINFIYIGALLYACVTFKWHLFGVLIILKILADLLMLSPMLVHFKKWDLVPYIPTASILHPFYILFTGVLAVWGKYDWKKRNYGDS
jgi:biofilm PGA synthesis N-glycosyltransferase PgaC